MTQAITSAVVLLPREIVNVPAIGNVSVWISSDRGIIAIPQAWKSDVASLYWLNAANRCSRVGNVAVSLERHKHFEVRAP
jgi:hypothetical protein